MVRLKVLVGHIFQLYDNWEVLLNKTIGINSYLSIPWLWSTLIAPVESRMYGGIPKSV